MVAALAYVHKTFRFYEIFCWFFYKKKKFVFLFIFLLKPTDYFNQYFENRIYIIGTLCFINSQRQTKLQQSYIFFNKLFLSISRKNLNNLPKKIMCSKYFNVPTKQFQIAPHLVPIVQFLKVKFITILLLPWLLNVDK